MDLIRIIFAIYCWPPVGFSFKIGFAGRSVNMLLTLLRLYSRYCSRRMGHRRR